MTTDYIVNDEPELPPARTYPATIKEMGWAAYLAALSDRLEGHLPDTIGAAVKKDVRNAAKVLRVFSDLEGLTTYLDTMSS